MPSRILTAHIDTFSLKQPFKISRGAKAIAECLYVTIEEDGYIGRGEAVPYARYGETPEQSLNNIEFIRPSIENGLDRDALQTLITAGAVRCALDCALWDLEAKQRGKPLWQLAGLSPPKPIRTAQTLSLDTPEQMAKAACKIQGDLLKLKFGSSGDFDRLEAIHDARPDADLIIDANEGLSIANFERICDVAAKMRVVVLEQPFHNEKDSALEPFIQHWRNDNTGAPTLLCADESAHTSDDLEILAKRYDAVNIKLDKTGGLTEALKMLRKARALDLRLMIGCMVASSLSLAPAFALAQDADYADLDGPLWLRKDRGGGLVFKDGYAYPPKDGFWG